MDGWMDDLRMAFDTLVESVRQMQLKRCFWARWAKKWQTRAQARRVSGDSTSSSMMASQISVGSEIKFEPSATEQFCG